MDLIQYIPKYKEELEHGFPSDRNNKIKISKYFVKSLQQRIKNYFETTPNDDVKEISINSEQTYFTNM